MKTMKQLGQLGVFACVVGLMFSRVAEAGLYGTWQDEGSVTYLDAQIAAGGGTAVSLTDLSPVSLSAIDGLFLLNISNGGFSSAILSATSALSEFVFNGGELHIWDRYVAGGGVDTNAILPGSPGIQFVRFLSADLTLGTPANPWFSGLTDSSFDGGTWSAHGYAAASTLPVDAERLLFESGVSDGVAEFAYAYGSGLVHYSTVPADFYFVGSGMIAESLRTEVTNIVTAGAPSPVPEPGEWGVLMCAGLGVLALVRRMRKSPSLRSTGAGVAALACAWVIGATPAKALTIGFDDVSADTSLPMGYEGFTWDNFWVLNGETYADSGYKAGVVSVSNVAFNAFGVPASLSRDVPFTLVSAWLTAAWHDGLSLQIDGYRGDMLAYSGTFAPSATERTLFTFNYEDVTRVEFTSSGGSIHTGYMGSGTHFAMDDVTVANSPVPEPGEWGILVGAGLGVLAVIRRKARQA